jgi:hypothetical protein
MEVEMDNIQKRFWTKVDKNGPIMPNMTTRCWIWLGGISEQGYAKFTIKDQSSQASHTVYEWFNGSIPDGKQIDHLCVVPLCVNPEHLEAVTSTQNNARKVKRSFAVVPYTSRIRWKQGIDQQLQQTSPNYNMFIVCVLEDTFYKELFHELLP